MKYPAHTRPQQGVTLIELLVVIAVAAILATLAGPSFSDLVQRTRQNSVISQLVSDLNRARSEAIKRNKPVLLCVRGTDTACGTSTNWQNGWLLCVGSTACDTPLSVHAALAPSLSLSANTDKIQFRPNGSNSSGAVTLTAGGTGLDSKVIVVSVTGSISRP